MSIFHAATASSQSAEVAAIEDFELSAEQFELGQDLSEAIALCDREISLASSYARFDAAIEMMGTNPKMSPALYNMLNTEGDLEMFAQYSGRTAVTTESMDPNNDNTEQGEIVLESMKEIAGTAIATIKKFFADLKERVKAIFIRWFTSAGRMQASLGALKAKESKIKEAENLTTKVNAMKHSDWDTINKGVDNAIADSKAAIDKALGASKDQIDKEFSTSELVKGYQAKITAAGDATNKTTEMTLEESGWTPDLVMSGIASALKAVETANALKAAATKLDSGIDEGLRKAEAAAHADESKKEEVALARKQLSAARTVASYEAKLLLKRAANIQALANVVLKVGNAMIADGKKKD